MEGPAVSIIGEMKTKCKVINCSRPSRTRGMCASHYSQMMKGNPELLALHPDVKLKTCEVGGCGSVALSRGWCNMHWKRWRAHGDPTIKLRADRNQGEWKPTPSGYMRAYRHGHPNAGKDGLISQHTFVMSEHLGRVLKPGETVHHRNGIRCDNRIDNLELWVSKHPAGQRVEDLLDFAEEIIEQYGSLRDQCYR